MSYIKHISYALTNAFQAGNIEPAPLRQRGSDVLGHSPIWLRELCDSLAGQKTLLLKSKQLRTYIQTFPALIEANQRGEIRPPLANYSLPLGKMSPAPDFLLDSVPAINNSNELLGFLQLSPQALHWLSQPWAAHDIPAQGPLQNYFYHWQVKSRADQFRLIEVPKQDLKAIQKKIASEILNKVPLHPNAHGFRKGHGIKTCAEKHQNKAWVLKMDLQNFFLSIRYARIYGIFASLGYPPAVARSLTLLSSNNVPESILKHKIQDWRARQSYKVPHLPQGAPSSPVLSNLAAFKLDCRLTGLANRLQADYSRYADDLFFSGQNYQDFSQLIPLIAAIVSEEHLHINYRKTRVMGRGQQQKVAGVVINQQTNLPRKEYDRLKATLYNCVQYGVASQEGSQPNFYAHLKGKLAFAKMLNPQKALKLEQLFAQINWEPERQC